MYTPPIAFIAYLYIVQVCNTLYRYAVNFIVGVWRCILGGVTDVLCCTGDSRSIAVRIHGFEIHGI